ncbi:hypothetical protein [Ferrimicrobium sp.]|uniref:hypothetical protein n=1 Tax=Ferrimicrobium sp. TaxID=2926050 RepID=UPI002632655B|nr:hypothetical protein [Ferrimicrobium sp.]
MRGKIVENYTTAFEVIAKSAQCGVAFYDKRKGGKPRRSNTLGITFSASPVCTNIRCQREFEGNDVRRVFSPSGIGERLCPSCSAILPIASISVNSTLRRRDLIRAFAETLDKDVANLQAQLVDQVKGVFLNLDGYLTEMLNLTQVSTPHASGRAQCRFRRFSDTRFGPIRTPVSEFSDT